MADDGPPLLFKRILGSLRPANQAATEAMAALDDSAVRVRITRTRGNQARMSLYWVVLGIAAPMLEERLDGPMTITMLHRILKRKGGLAKPVTLPSGEVEWDYESISFSKMPEPDRAEYITWSLRTLASWLGVTEEELRNEGMAA